MNEEIEANRGMAPTTGNVRAPATAARPVHEPWVVRNERFLRTMFMICAYVFGALCLVSIFALGAFAFISGVLAGIVLVSVLAVLVLLKFRRKRPAGGARTR